MDVQELWQEFAALRCDDGLFVATNLAGREKAMTLIAFINRIACTRRHQPQLLALQRQARVFQQQLEAINARLFQTVQSGIRAGWYPAQTLRQELDQYTAYRADRPGHVHFGHEGLDVLVRGVLEIAPLPAETKPRGKEMIHFERTPASAVLEMIDRASITPGAVFYDLGSGLGQVVILVNLLTGIRAKGIEVEPAYHEYAQQCRLTLGLRQVVLINADVRAVDYSDGDIFFMFTPFTGSLLQTVLDKLRDVAAMHTITLCTYGPCTLAVAQQPWLKKLDDHYEHEFKLAIFRSA